MPPAMLPGATYRLQFHAGFTFDDATAMVEYLHALGISHAYASSYFAAVPGSLHGYDVADPTRLNPEIGAQEAYLRWVAALRARGMGHIIDLVPNHMGIAKSANPWWQDVLENGPSSLQARVFDIDWHPLKPELEHKVLIPILGDSYGAVLERQEISLRYGEGVFSLHYFETTLPIAPRSYAQILETDVDALVRALGDASIEAAEYLSILTAIRRLPERRDSLGKLLEGRQVCVCDVERDDEIAGLARSLQGLGGSFDGLVHSIAFAPKEALEGEFVTTTRDAFRTALEISAPKNRHSEPISPQIASLSLARPRLVGCSSISLPGSGAASVSGSQRA